MPLLCFDCNCWTIQKKSPEYKINHVLDQLSSVATSLKVSIDPICLSQKTCPIDTFCLVTQVVVQHVNIQGLGRTKEDLLGYEISDVFHAKNLIDVCISCLMVLHIKVF